MLAPGYTQRINIQAIAQFILTGDELIDPEPGTPAERDRRNQNEIEKMLRHLVRRGSNNWDDLSDHEKVLLYERETDELRRTLAKQARVALELGCMAGIRLAAQYRETEQSFPELPLEPPLNASKWRADINNREKEST